MEYIKGTKLKFYIYGTILEGDFMGLEGDYIRIKTTLDFVKENIGKTQKIHKSHPHLKVDK